MVGKVRWRVATRKSYDYRASICCTFPEGRGGLTLLPLTTSTLRAASEALTYQYGGFRTSLGDEVFLLRPSVPNYVSALMD